MEKYLESILSDRSDRSAWEELFFDNRALLSQVLHKYIFNRSDHDDVRQEIFLKLIGNIGSYDTSKPFKAWFYVLAKRVCLDYLKRNYKGSARVEALDEKTSRKMPSFVPYDETYEPKAQEQRRSTDFTENVVQKLAIEQALSTVEDKEQVLVFKLQYYDGMTINDIAKLLGRPVSTIHNWPNRVKEKIKPVLGELLEIKFTRGK